MKLRQKLALVLASAMIVTAVPVVTFAESTNKLSHPVSSVAGTVVTDTEGLSLIMDFGDTILKESTSFYLKADAFKFSAPLYGARFINEDALMGAFENALGQVDVTKLGQETIEGYTAAGYTVNEVVYKVQDEQVLVDGFKVTFNYTKNPVAAAARTTADKEVTKTVKLSSFYSVADRELTSAMQVVVKNAQDVMNDINVIDENGKPVEDVVDPTVGTDKALRITDTQIGNLTPGQMVIEYLDTDMIRVTVKADSKTKVRIPILGTIQEGTPSITVDPLDSYATAGTYFLTRENVEDGNRLGVKVADAAPIPVDGGAIADITITEKEQNSIKDPSTATTKAEEATIIKNNKVTFTLPSSSDLVFAKESLQQKYVRFTGKRAFAPNNNKTYTDLDNVTFEVSKDGKTLTIGLPTDREVTTTTGEWVISGIQVLPEETRYDATIGDVNVTIDGEMIKKESHKVAVVTDYDQTLTAKEVVELYSGKGSKEVVVTLKENVKESLDDKRWAYFELTEGAYIKVDAGTVIEDKVNGNYSTDLKASSAVTMNINGTDVAYDEDLMQLIINEDGNVTGFKVQFEYLNADDTVDANKGKLDPNKANTIKFTFNVQADTQTTGKVELKADSKAFEVEPVQIANVTAPIEVAFDETTVKVGLEAQQLGKITIKETAAGMLTKGELVIDADEAGVKFVNSAKDLKVTTPEGSTLKVNVKRVDANGIVLSIDRTAKEASEFTIEGIVADIDRTVPEGKVAIEVFGDSLRAFDGVWGDSVYNEKDGHRPTKGFIYEANGVEEFDAPHKFVTDGYIVVGTKNTEDLPNAAQAKEIILTVNSTSYTVNGEAKTADAAAFIDANNRTMVPVRFVAEEFGKIEFGTLNGVGTVTVFKDGNVLQFQNGSKIMNKNGIAIPMDTATVIKDGRTYVPFKYVAQGLGINYNFDDATKSITFTNQVK